MIPFPESESRIELAGPAGALEAIVTPARSDGAASGVTIVCHPHSLQGGTMTNKVVHTIARARRDLGHHVVRFNFRGVGASAGEYDEGVGEQQDLAAVVLWARQACPALPVWIAGFSFGGYVAAGAVGTEQLGNIAHLLLVAPAVTRYAFDALTTFPCPLTVVYGDQDEVVESTAIGAWAEQVSSPVRVVLFEGAGHFFHGRLTELKSLLEQDFGRLSVAAAGNSA